MVFVFAMQHLYSGGELSPRKSARSESTTNPLSLPPTSPRDSQDIWESLFSPRGAMVGYGGGVFLCPKTGDIWHDKFQESVLYGTDLSTQVTLPAVDAPVVSPPPPQRDVPVEQHEQWMTDKPIANMTDKPSLTAALLAKHQSEHSMTSQDDWATADNVDELSAARTFEMPDRDFRSVKNDLLTQVTASFGLVGIMFLMLL